MAILQDELNRLIGELCTDASVRLELVRYVFSKRGILLTDSQLQSVAKAIEDCGDADSVDVDIDGITQPITFTSDDIEHAWVEFEEKLDVKVERANNFALEKMAPDILKTLYADLPQMLHERRATHQSFEERLHQRWQDGLDRLEMLIVMAHESRDTYVKDLRHEFDRHVSSQDSVLIDVLVALHCRACRTAQEILCLLKSGYADGANARWRSLHELAVTALFLVEHRGDAPQRYFDHAAVERWRAAEQYQTHCRTLGYEPFSADELKELRKAYDDATTKYGALFKEDYGWAASALGVAKPTFTQIEANLDMSKWRPFVRFACQSVHAGAQGLYFSLGVLENRRAMLLTGASNAGLADPGHTTAISLTLASVALLTSYPNLDGLVICKCMLILCKDVEAALFQAHNKLERDDAKK